MSLGGKTWLHGYPVTTPCWSQLKQWIAVFQFKVSSNSCGFQWNQMKFVLFASGDYSFDEGLYRIAMTNCHHKFLVTQCRSSDPRPKSATSQYFFPTLNPVDGLMSWRAKASFFQTDVGPDPAVVCCLSMNHWTNLGMSDSVTWVTAWQCESGRQEESGNVLLDAFVRVCHELWHLDDSQWDGNGREDYF